MVAYGRYKCGLSPSLSCFRDKEKTEKIIKSLSLRILPRDSRSTDSRVHLHAICHQWLPLADSLLSKYDTGFSERNVTHMLHIKAVFGCSHITSIFDLT